ncbi:MAG: hypothetical protein ACI83B_002907 [Sediminicola sp.]|jgi:hypothetical protein|tara:strand:+ start:3122 stop:3568 length:447 start_codon:yes stop_codon:yes gene_type:complete
MLTPTLKLFFERDLNKLKLEIESYQNEANIWRIEDAILNSSGNLCLHLIGNLNAFIGAELGNTGYVRDREFEFSGKQIPKRDLIEKIDHTLSMINSTLDSLNKEQLKQEYPKIIFKEKMSVEYFLIHLTTHLTYHLGQINYHRRLLDK